MLRAGGGGKGGSCYRTNQPHLKSHLTPLGLRVLVLKVGRKSANLNFYALRWKDRFPSRLGWNPCFLLRWMEKPRCFSLGLS